MFDIKLNEPRLLNNTISIISEFITEATFNITKEGIKLTAMDPANISMVVLNILPSAFTEFIVDGKDEITVNLGAMNQALKRAKPTDSLQLTSEGNKLKIVILGKSTKKFYIPLLEKEGQERRVPVLNFDAEIDIDAFEFKDYIEDASVVSDALTFEANPAMFILSAGETGTKVNIELKKGAGAITKIEVKEPSRSIYSVDYLKKMVKASSLSDAASIKFSKDYPLHLGFKAINKLQMNFILAPRIENK